MVLVAEQRCSATGKVTVGLASHWPDLSGLSTYGLKAEVREMSTPPTSFVGCGTLYLLPRLLAQSLTVAVVPCRRVFVSGQITTNATTTGSVQQLRQPRRQTQRASLAPTHLTSSSSSSVAAAGKDDDTRHHPAPLFLRHVVNRRFKYRWLILAVSGFTCMSIIVVLSTDSRLRPGADPRHLRLHVHVHHRRTQRRLQQLTTPYTVARNAPFSVSDNR